MKRPGQSVLVIEEDAASRESVSGILSSRGYAVHCASHTREGIEAFLRVKPDFVLLSISKGVQECVAALRDICKADPYAQVITLSACAEVAHAMECIRQGAVDFLRKPVAAGDLIRSLERIANRRRILRFISDRDMECVREESKKLVFGNSMTGLPYVINQAVCNAGKVCENLDLLKTALGEILINAIEHGNLGITGDEKSAAIERGDYDKLLRERTDIPRSRRRKVTLEVHMAHDELRYTVTDQGDGFDFTGVFDADPHNRIGSGLGLFIARSFFSDISYHGNGNRVTLVYRKPAHGKEMSDEPAGA